MIVVEIGKFSVGYAFPRHKSPGGDMQRLWGLT